MTANPAVWVAMAVTLIGGLGVLLAARLVRAAVWLFVTLLGIAGLMLAGGLQFLAGMQLLIYSGGTLVLVVFGIMLTTQVNPVAGRVKRVGWGVWLGGLFLAGLIGAAMLTGTSDAWQGAGGRAMRASLPAPAVTEKAAADGVILPLGEWLMGPGLVVFEWTSLLLVIAMVGAAAIVRPPDDADRSAGGVGGES